MASTHKLMIIEGKDGGGGAEELGMVNDLDALLRLVEQVDPTNVLEDLIPLRLNHVVRHNRRKQTDAAVA